MSEAKWTRHDDTYYASSYRGWKLRVDSRWAGWQWIIERVGLVGEKTIVGGVSGWGHNPRHAVRVAEELHRTHDAAQETAQV